jgi:biotin synthase
MTMLDQLLAKAARGNGLEPQDAQFLLDETLVGTPSCARLLETSNQLSRRLFGGFAEVHAQIGLNWGACSRTCGFCVFCTDEVQGQPAVELSTAEVVELARGYEEEGVTSIALMATANYKFDGLLEMGRAVRGALRTDVPLVANCGDIGPARAKALVRAGYGGYYHALRLREGTDTNLRPYKRIASMNAARGAGLFLGSCLEPIGPEHTTAELVELMTTLRNAEVGAVAVMKRVNHPGSPLAARGEINDHELARIGAVTRLFFGRSIVAFGAHEPNLACLRAGANVVYAEAGANPRDHADSTIRRGRTVEECRRMLKQANLKSFRGSTTARYVRLALLGNRPMRKFLFRFVRNQVTQVVVRPLAEGSAITGRERLQPPVSRA